MLTRMWMYDAILYMYALSLLFYFSDYMRPSQSAKRMGTGLLSLVWILQSLFFADRIVELRYMPVVTVFETIFFYSWLVVTLSLVMNWFMRIDMVTFFLNLIGFSMSALNLFSHPSASPTLPHWESTDELLFVHITLAIGSYVAFSVAAILAGMHLFLHRKLKGRQWSSVMKRLPSMDRIESYTFFFVGIGVPLLVLSLALGIVELILLGDLQLLTDPKVLMSLLILPAYAFYLFGRLGLNMPGSQLAKWNLAAFSVVLLNIVISGFSRFH